MLQHRIVSGEWPLNSKIPTEAELAAELGVGRSTIREAVRTLAGVGMLEPARSRGTFVRSLTPVSGVLSDFMNGHALDDLLATRIGLEDQAARQAALNHTPEDLAALRRAHDADVDSDSGSGTSVERGSTPGQFHALVVRAAHNGLLADLHSAVMNSLREAMAQARVVPGIEEPARRSEHSALLDAIAARDPERAAALARAHAAGDLVAVGAHVTPPA